MTSLYDLTDHFGNIDIYLFDQLLKRRIAPGMAVFDAGCGRGRNIHYLLRAGHQVYGVDLDSTAIDAVRALAAELAPELPPTNFRMESLESNSFPDNIADMVICSAVLHFASNEAHFAAMLDGVWRVLASGGICFVRLASTIGLENEVKPLGSRRYILPDGSERFLVDAALLERAEEQLGAQRLDPLKTTVVQDLRAMTTWVLRKPE